MTISRFAILALLSLQVAGCSAPDGKKCLGASEAVSESEKISAREQCVLSRSEKLPKNVLDGFRLFAQFETLPSGEIAVRVVEGNSKWIITELGFDASVDTPGLPHQIGYVFWRGYQEPPHEIWLSPPRWRIGNLQQGDKELARNPPDDLWRITRIAGRGIYVGDQSRLERWWKS